MKGFAACRLAGLGGYLEHNTEIAFLQVRDRRVWGNLWGVPAFWRFSRLLTATAFHQP